MVATTLSTTPAAVASTRGRPGWADLSVRVKIIAAVLVAALVALLVGVLGLSALSDASRSAQQIYSSNVASVSAIGSLNAAIRQTRLDTASQALSQDAPTITKYEKAFGV